MANFFTGSDAYRGTLSDANALRRAISAYSHQEYFDNVRIAGTALVGADARISTNDEDFFGTIRWVQPLGDVSGAAIVDGSTASDGSTAINIATEDSTEGEKTDVDYDTSKYIKTVRTAGASQFNVTQVLSDAPNAIEKLSRDFGVARARDADSALLSVLRGVAATEAGTGSAGQVITNPRNSGAGFYVDHGTSSLIGDSSATSMGAARANLLWETIGAGFGDLEPSFFYLVIDPQTYQDIRSANLVDQDRVRDGNVDVDTMLSGKIRLIVTQSVSTHNYSSLANVTGARTSYLMLPGAMYMHDLAVPNPVAFDADESVGGGMGEREIWYRWGNIYHPQGYTWNGSTSGFARNVDVNQATQGSVAGFYNVVDGGTGVGSNPHASVQPWDRPSSRNVMELGILPIFHA